jgi:hypothetical protein
MTRQTQCKATNSKQDAVTGLLKDFATSSVPCAVETNPPLSPVFATSLGGVRHASKKTFYHHFPSSSFIVQELSAFLPHSLSSLMVAYFSF